MRPPPLTLFSLGGTIAMTPSGQGGVAPALTGSDLVAAIPSLADIADISVEDLGRRASANLGFAEIIDLATRIEQAVASGAQGIVVSQGTDTMAECAFLLGCLLRLSIPVVVTGAMRHPGLASADGPGNLLDAARAAATPSLGDAGVLVAMNGELYAARFAAKRHSCSTAAFASPGSGPVAVISEGRVHRYQRPCLPPHLPWPEGARRIPRIFLVPAVFDDDAGLLDRLPPDLDGLVIEALGAGHVGEAMSDKVARLARNVPVVLASRTGAGPVLEDTYGYKGAEIDLIGRGAIPAGLYDPHKARILLTLACARRMAAPEIRALFSH